MLRLVHVLVILAKPGDLAQPRFRPREAIPALRPGEEEAHIAHLRHKDFFLLTFCFLVKLLLADLFPLSRNVLTWLSEPRWGHVT